MTAIPPPALAGAPPTAAATELATTPGTTPEPWLESLTTARAAARAGDRLILVDLYAEWCGWCKHLERDVFAAAEFQPFASRFVLLRVDTEDRGEGSALQARFGAHSLPTTLILDADLVQVGKIEGYSPLPQYRQRIERAIELHRELLAMYDRFAGSDEPSVLGKLAGELIQRGDGRRAATLLRRLIELERPGPEREAELRYRLAEALLLAEEAEPAELALVRARELAAGDEALLEACDLLRIRIAQARGDCDRTRHALEAFLADHPESLHRSGARAVLRSLGEACT